MILIVILIVGLIFVNFVVGLKTVHHILLSIKIYKPIDAI